MKTGNVNDLPIDNLDGLGSNVKVDEQQNGQNGQQNQNASQNDGNAGNGNQNLSPDNNSNTDANLEIEVSLDDKGNVINDKGEVLIEAANVQKDEEGNLIISNELADKFKQEKPSLVDNFRKEFSESLGINYVDDKGQPIVFEKTENGLKDFINFTIENGAINLIQTREKELFTKFPDVENYILHRYQGGSPEEFFSKPIPDIETIKFDSKDQTFQFNVVVQAGILRGLSKEDATLFAEKFEKDGKLLDRSKADFDFIKQDNVNKKEAATKAIEEQNRKQKEDDAKFWNTVETTVKKRTFKGLSIAEQEVNPFMDYLAKPVKNGLTQSQIDAQNADIETQIALEYLRYKGLNLSTLVQNMAKNLNVQKIKAKVLNQQIDTSNAGNNRQTVRQGNIEDITIDSLFN